MFTSEAAITPLRVRTPGILAGSAIMAAVAAALVSAKTLPFLYGVVLLSFLGAAAMRGRLGDALPRANAVNVSLLALWTYAIISSSWAMVPGMSLITTLYGLAVAAASIAMVQLVAGDERARLLHMGEGLWLGLLVALVYVGIELASGQSIKIFLYNLAGLQPGDLAPPSYFIWAEGKIVAILREDLTRNMAPLTLFLWPTVAAVMGTIERRYAAIFAAALVLASGVVIMTAWHETSKLAFVVGLLVFLAARYAPRFVGRLAMVAWVVACLGTIPAVLMASRLDLQDASWLQASARHRIIIWQETAERTLQSPLLGSGARTTYFLGPSLEKMAPHDSDPRRSLSTHAHNAFLQVWFELGFVGATLLTVFGVMLLRAITAFDAAVRPYAFATFAVASVMAASSYGIWQYWYLAMFALTAVLCRLGMELLAPASLTGHADSREPPKRTLASPS